MEQDYVNGDVDLFIPERWLDATAEAAVVDPQVGLGRFWRTNAIFNLALALVNPLKESI